MGEPKMKERGSRSGCGSQRGGKINSEHLVI